MMTSLQRGDSMSGLLGTMEGLVQAEASIPESPANEPDSAADGDPLLESSSAEELQLYSIPSIDPQLPRITPLSSIGEAFSVRHAVANKTVLLTGATGYVGSLVLEQLLRTCPGCKIITIIRGKNGMSPRQRLEKLLNRQLFQELAPHRQEVLRRTVVLDAELCSDGCGIAETDLHKLAAVDYIMHCAASIRFDLPIQEMMKQNYTTTSNLLDLAKDHIDGLLCFTYVSTAFVNFNQPEGTQVKEQLYPLEKGSSWEDDVALAERLISLPEEQANAEAHAILKRLGFLNTYMLSKNLAEKMVMLRDNKPVPVAIVRPSIIGSLSSAPCPGYIGNTSGFTGVILGVGAGIITVSNHDPHRVFPLVPADIVSSTIIAMCAAVGADAAAFNGNLYGKKIVHACTSTTMPVTGNRIQLLASSFMNEDPVERRVTWRSEYTFRHVKSRLVFEVVCFFHSIKLRLYTFALRMIGYQRIASKVMDMWHQYRLVGSADAQINVTFDSTSLGHLHALMPVEERFMFKVLWHKDMQDSWLRYIRTYCAGTKHFYLNQAPRVFDMQDFQPSLLVGRPSVPRRTKSFAFPM